MKPQLKMNSFVGLSLMISLLAFAPEPSLAACKNSGGSAGKNSVGSQVNGSSVVICASAVAVVPARAAVVKSKTILKPKVVPVVFRRPQTPALKPVTVSVANKPIPKPTLTKTKTVVQKKVAKKIVSTPGSTSKTSASAEFSPAQVSARVYPSDQLTVGQTASFSASALQHFKSGTLLKLPTEVRFTPIGVDWDIQGDDASNASAARGSLINHVFSSAGLFQAKVMVTYAVSYRVKGSLAWIAEPDSISMVDELVIYVSGDGAEQPDEPAPQNLERRARLVASDCLKRPGSFGCE